MTKQHSLLAQVQRASKRKRPAREATITKSILDWLNSLPGCHAVKRHGTAFGQRGEADITGCFAINLVVSIDGSERKPIGPQPIFGYRFEIEVKIPGEDATPLQAERLSQWAAAGALTGVVHSLEEVQALFKAAHLI